MNDITKFSLSFPQDFIPPYPKDFSIFVGPIAYQCHICYLAAFSPKINQMVLCDPTIRFIQYAFDDPKEQFPLFIQLVYGKKAAIDQSNIDFFANTATFFGNCDLLAAVSEYYIKISPNFIFLRLEQNLPIQYFTREIEFIAEHFEQLLNYDRMNSLSLAIYDSILSCPKLDISDDHNLFNFVTNLVRLRGKEFQSLYAHIIFDSLNSDEIDCFLSYVKSEEITGALWRTISRRLIKNVVTVEKSSNSITSPMTDTTKPIYQYTDKVVDVPPELQILSQVFPYAKGGHFKGIFGFLGKNGNPQHRGYITMECGGNKRRFLHKLLDYSVHTYRWDNFSGEKCQEKDQWFTIEFTIYKVMLEKYTLSTPEEKPDKSQPKSWCIYGSNDGNEWKLIHEVNNSVTMNQPRAIVVYTCNSNEFFSHFKIVQTANHSKFLADKYEFTLNHIEFFGELRKL